MTGPTGSVKLRRTPLAVVLAGNPALSWLLLFTGAAVAWAAFESRSGDALIAYAVGALWFVRSFILGVSLRGPFVFEQAIFMAPRRTPVAEIIGVRVGVANEWAYMWRYRGFVLAIDHGDGDRFLTHSYFCGRRRLERWAQQIADHPDFVGDVEVTSSVIYETPEPRRR